MIKNTYLILNKHNLENYVLEYLNKKDMDLTSLYRYRISPIPNTTYPIRLCDFPYSLKLDEVILLDNLLLIY